ncbi:Uncharacterised protein [Corynebacterium renale]|uniref:InlB B-repeat-containing protein n=1 Tax=Corynebacterium renale TaxID=1724 RepID=UPI000DA3BFF6|nr:hypothetical protein [Corynebacterium renale]SQG65337.1 Uncharacterised protein [Corynebacterium renale]STC98730.1 Uncharacterised protein [Corynebacterium renale]
MTKLGAWRMALAATATLALVGAGLPVAHAADNTLTANTPQIAATEAPGCTAVENPKKQDLDVKFEVLGPSEINPGTDLHYKLRGEGYNPGTTPGATNGFYLVLAPTSVWRLGMCNTMTGDGDSLQAQWITPAQLNRQGGKFDIDFTIKADSLSPGKTYTLGIMAAHGLALTERYFDRGITIKVPETATSGVPDATAVAGNATKTPKGLIDVDVTWNYPETVPGTSWRVAMQCVENCVSTRPRTIDLAQSDRRSYTFPDSDAGVYVASVTASRTIDGSVVSSHPVESERFVVGDVQAPISRKLEVTGGTTDAGEYVKPGTQVTVTPDSAPGKKLERWDVPGVTGAVTDPATGILTFPMPDAPVHAKAVYTDRGRLSLPATVHPGERIELVAEDLLPGEDVTFALGRRAVAKKLGTVTADAAGRATMPFTVPADAVPGDLTVSAYLTGYEREATLTIVKPESPQTPEPSEPSAPHASYESMPTWAVAVLSVVSTLAAVILGIGLNSPIFKAALNKFVHP